jgi:hypothetical protein
MIRLKNFKVKMFFLVTMVLFVPLIIAWPAWCVGIRKMRVIGIYETGGAADYRVMILDSGTPRVGVLKGEQKKHQIGDELHSFLLREEVDEYGLSAYKVQQITDAGSFHDGWACVKLVINNKGRYAAMDIDGNFLEPHYKDPFARYGSFSSYPIEFSEGIAFCFAGPINTKGEFIFNNEINDKLSIPNQEERGIGARAMRFSGGVSPVLVRTSDNKLQYSLITNSGDTRPITLNGRDISSAVTNIGAFSDGMAWCKYTVSKSDVLFGQEGHIGFINSKDELHIENSREFLDKTPFSPNVDLNKAGLGEIVRSFGGPFRDGVSVVANRASMLTKNIVVDKTGQKIFEMGKGQETHSFFSEGLLGVEEKSERYPRKWAYIDKNGKQVTNFNFDGAGTFSEGLAAVNQGNKWGYINKKGEPAIKFQFNKASPFSEGLAAVTGEGYGSGWKYIDKMGKTVIEPKDGDTFEDANHFSEGYALVRVRSDRGGGKWAYIDTSGDIKLWFN